jgi:hypothetical protein
MQHSKSRNAILQSLFSNTYLMIHPCSPSCSIWGGAMPATLYKRLLPLDQNSNRTRSAHLCILCPSAPRPAAEAKPACVHHTRHVNDAHRPVEKRPTSLDSVERNFCVAQAISDIATHVSVFANRFRLLRRAAGRH